MKENIYYKKYCYSGWSKRRRIFKETERIIE